MYNLNSSVLCGPSPAKLSEKDFAALTGMLIELEFNDTYVCSDLSLCKCMNYSNFGTTVRTRISRDPKWCLRFKGSNFGAVDSP